MRDKKNTSNSDYLALYRKYRPQEFKEVIGQDLAVQTLENAIKNHRIHHAYIFYGDRGIGKTTLARIFAKEIGCSADDIFELNAASNTGVDDMRLIIDATQTSTFGSAYKVYILDEAHMLSNSAFNALLKTLEEPPSHVIFILATTRKDKIPNTIISRCQVIDLVSPNIETLVKVITKVSQSEKRELEESSKRRIAEEGRGSFRDTLGVLEKVFTTLEQEKISLEDLERFFETVPEQEISKVIEALGEKDLAKFLDLIENLNLVTQERILKFYLSLVKFLELALYLRFIGSLEASKTFGKSVEEKEISKAQELSQKYPKFISSQNLKKVLDLESKLNLKSNLGKTILILGLVELVLED